MPTRVAYNGPGKEDRDKWLTLFLTMPEPCREWVKDNARKLYARSDSATAIPRIGVEGSQELMTKLLIFLVKREVK